MGGGSSDDDDGDKKRKTPRGGSIQKVQDAKDSMAFSMFGGVLCASLCTICELMHELYAH